MWVGFEILLVLKVPFPKNMQNEGTREQTSIISLDLELNLRSSVFQSGSGRISVEQMPSFLSGRQRHAELNWGSENTMLSQLASFGICLVNVCHFWQKYVRRTGGWTLHSLLLPVFLLKKVFKLIAIWIWCLLSVVLKVHLKSRNCRSACLKC